MMMMFYGSWNVLFYDDDDERIHARRRKVDEDFNDDGDCLEGNMDARQN